jgi:hypothetical protein
LNFPRPRKGGGPQPGSGRPKGVKLDRTKALAKKILWGKRPGREAPRIQELFEKFLDGPTEDYREREMVLKALGQLVDLIRRPPEGPAAKSGGTRVMVLPDKKTEKDWMADHNQREVLDMADAIAGVKPN